MTPPRILVVDNHDSFVHILADRLRQQGAAVRLRRGDAIRREESAALVADADAVLLSPGPGAPRDALGSMIALAEASRRGLPVLGVCLGLQVIAEAFGASVAGAPTLRHGVVSRIRHDGRGLFAGLPQDFAGARYHSLAVLEPTLPEALEVSARSEDGVVMALRHRAAPITGVQFHPESILTEHGDAVLANWLSSVPLREEA